MTQQQSVVVAGVGPGLGIAVARRFAEEGYEVALLARGAERLGTLAAYHPDRLTPMVCDVTDPSAVETAFAKTERELGPVACAIFNAGTFRRGSILDITPDDFEHCWRVGAFAGFLVGQAAARRMAARRAGTILFTGATASLRGGSHFANLASPKFALRALAQSMARELGPSGVHVAHIIIDGSIGVSVMDKEDDTAPDNRLSPEAIADTYVHLHRQHRSAWAHEIDLRPWVEKF